VKKLRNLTHEESRVLTLKLVFALLIVGYLMLFVWSGLALALGILSIYIVFLLNIIRKLFP
jgi:asparagine N-glycosylation enzyme membrane subunit Stt3